MRFVEVPSAWVPIVRIVAEYDDAELGAMLTPEEIAALAELRTDARRRERAASRIAAKLLAREHGVVDRYDRVGFDKDDARPVVTVDGSASAVRISFSHAAGIGAAALYDLPVGIDLERERAIDPRATKFFLRDAELESSRRCAVANPLLHWWCAKEAAFKLGGDAPTLLRVPLELEEETPGGLVLRGADGSRVETVSLIGGLVAALALAR